MFAKELGVKSLNHTSCVYMVPYHTEYRLHTYNNIYSIPYQDNCMYKFKERVINFLNGHFEP